ncbi:hypothetical protein [Pyxidicoccus xibeiensis]|uniref:hypothetical protein n=1 Tax=Pyxidicoccus xibeiensis TaxID=2906759 RepID=UPI0020A6FA26|nr:hypothetical protein [Pyxidicoccus xibeiensis]MCP3139158.1 hypothetical protein [Pyxidicoccus xibeiensis]
MIRHPLRARAARGAAAVEMAISLLVIIPVFMYAIFLDDLLRYSLDAQEAAVSTVWDFAVQDYTRDLKPADRAPTAPQGGSTMVQQHARYMFCDHESGKDRYDAYTNGVPSDCSDTDHHQALVAHTCWLNDNARQVTCEAPERGAGNLGIPVHNQFMSNFTRGGLIRCSARAVVENYLLPEGFLQEFSKTKLTVKKWDGDVHGNSQSGVATTNGVDGNAYFLGMEQMAILTDTWALTTNANTMPGTKSGEMYDRVANVYMNPQNLGHPILRATSAAFFGQAISNNLLNPLFAAQLAATTGDAMGADNPQTPNIAIAPQAVGDSTTPSNRVTQEGSNRRYFNTEWRDWDQNNNYRSYQNRGVYYMGCKQPGTC